MARKKQKELNSKHKWTHEELEYLRQQWGQVSIPYIAKTLKRSVEAIRIKAYRIGLGNFIMRGEYITISEFYNCLGVSYKGHDIQRLIAAKFPISEITIVTKKRKVIFMDTFFNWFKKNIHLLDLSKCEKGCFGYEPEWFDIKRQADKRANTYKKTKWTESEDRQLLSLLKFYKYGYRELSIKLKRTEGAIRQRLRDLKVKMRPIRAEDHNLWTEDEVKKLKELYMQGYKPCIIAEYINRTALAIQGKLEHENFFRGG